MMICPDRLGTNKQRGKIALTGLCFAPVRAALRLGSARQPLDRRSPGNIRRWLRQQIFGARKRPVELTVISGVLTIKIQWQ